MPGASYTFPEWRELLEEVGAVELKRRTLVAFNEVALELEAQAKLNAGADLKVRSGRLRASIRGYADEEAGLPRIVLQAGGSAAGGQVVYAGVQEFGATIRPTAGDFLRIPLGPSLTAAGVERFQGSIRDEPDFFPFRSASGDLYIGRVGDMTSPGAPRAWYRLVRSVTVTGSRFLGRAMDKVGGTLQPRLEDIFRISLAGDRV